MASAARLVRRLTSARPPWAISMSKSTWADVGGALEDHRHFRVIDVPGRATRTKVDLLATLARALACPRYFGHNWDALADCVRDLEWLPARGYVVLVRDGEQLLADEPAERETFRALVDAAGEHWAEGGIPFHVVFVTPGPGQSRRPRSGSRR